MDKARPIRGGSLTMPAPRLIDNGHATMTTKEWAEKVGCTPKAFLKRLARIGSGAFTPLPRRIAARCQQCDLPVPGHRTKKRFCSIECYSARRIANKLRRLLRNCAQCGVEFVRRQSEKPGQKSSFCSDTCRAASRIPLRVPVGMPGRRVIASRIRSGWTPLEAKETPLGARRGGGPASPRGYIVQCNECPKTRPVFPGEQQVQAFICQTCRSANKFRKMQCSGCGTSFDKRKKNIAAGKGKWHLCPQCTEGACVIGGRFASLDFVATILGVSRRIAARRLRRERRKRGTAVGRIRFDSERDLAHCLSDMGQGPATVTLAGEQFSTAELAERLGLHKHTISKRNARGGAQAVFGANRLSVRDIK